MYKKVLTALEIKRISDVGLHNIGVKGLYLKVNEGGSKSWILRLTFAGKRKDIGLGGYPAISLAQATAQATQIRKLVEHDRIDPIEEKKRKDAEIRAKRQLQKTFAEVKTMFFKEYDFGKGKSQAQWESSLRDYAMPKLEHLLVEDITTDHVFDVLVDIWATKTETAKRVQSRIKMILDFATVRKFRKGYNPASWDGNLSVLLKAPRKVTPVEHFSFIQPQHLYQFIKDLKANSSMGAKCLHFLALTAVRSGSARNCRWEQIDFEKKIWTVPKEHTKTKEEHIVALSSQAIELLKSMHPVVGTNLVFPSPTLKVLSDSTLSKLMREIQAKESYQGIPKGVPHGLRSSFATWRINHTEYPFDLQELALMHKVGNAVSQSYMRGNGLARRFIMMQDYADFMDKPYIHIVDKENRKTA